jgi:FkbM family methyltransferase
MTDNNQDNFKAQFNEDKLLFEHFQRKERGYYVEVGACDGCYASNTFFFEQLGWQGLLIEPIPELAEKCRETRPKSKVICSAAVASDLPGKIEFEVVEGWEALSSIALNRERLYDYKPDVRTIIVSAKRLDSILEEAGVGEIDFITIDVEGHEWEALQGLTISRWRPEVIILERWSTLPDPQIMHYMHNNGYLYERTTGGLNDWFIRATVSKSGNFWYRFWLNLRLYLPAHLTNLPKVFKNKLAGSATVKQ